MLRSEVMLLDTRRSEALQIQMQSASGINETIAIEMLAVLFDVGATGPLC